MYYYALLSCSFYCYSHLFYCIVFEQINDADADDEGDLIDSSSGCLWIRGKIITTVLRCTVYYTVYYTVPIIMHSVHLMSSPYLGELGSVGLGFISFVCSFL